MPLYNPAFVASADINPSRFVKISGEFSVAQCSASTDSIIGISQEGSYAPPGGAEIYGATPTYVAAPSGKTLKVFGPGDVTVVESSAAITAGAKLTAASDGRAVTAATGDSFGAIALESCTGAGFKIRVLVNLGQLN
jgi:hypothetical protein